MRTFALFASMSVVMMLASLPALAQMSNGGSASNATNQSFQQQNATRGIGQQNTFNNNQNTLNRQINQMNNAPRNTGAYRRAR